ncbi:uncharacterized protein KY384_004459 [Bacidia gigantensis]|uniref:uncharacterized protein n=1 Tax=Bacidia gigantensis TaxID=2732470 RepID=UPI001D04A260|nr:uncharacterized protein KY384_004459 [Bacidia gigantensis]KAG8531102.1 hypothetical protein KY384_004459 [Bacidia gigantensis]
MEDRESRNARAYGESSRRVEKRSFQDFPLVPPTASPSEVPKSGLSVGQASQRPSRRSLQASGTIQSPKTPYTAEGIPTPILSNPTGDQLYSSQELQQSSAKDDFDSVQEVNIAVLGCSHVGKSTFMQCALDSKKQVFSPVLSKKVSLEGSISIVCLIEMDIKDVEVQNGSLQWPKKVKDYLLPRIDGSLILFDITNLNSIEMLPRAVSALGRDSIPTVLVASKCDTSPKSWRVTPRMVDSMVKDNKDIQSFQTALCTPETHKRCISIMLRNVILQRHGDPCAPQRNHRPRAATSSQPTSPLKIAQNPTSRSKHGRAASELPENVPYESFNIPIRNSEPIRRPVSPSKFLHSAKDEKATELDHRQANFTAIAPSDRPDDHGEDFIFSSESKQVLMNVLIASRTNSTQSDSTEAVSHTNDSSLSDLSQKDSLLTSHQSRPESDQDQSSDLGVPFENLVDRLLAPPMSKQDTKFVVAFLCLYRIFAAPSELLAAILKRFEGLPGDEMPQLVRLTMQLRYLNILQEWISEYQGDFAHPATRHVITTFVHSLSMNPEFATAHQEISIVLEAVGEDDDAEWAYSDQARSRASTIESFLSSSSTQTATSTITAESSAEEINDTRNPEKPIHGHSVRHPTNGPVVPSLESSGSPSTNLNSRMLLNRVADARGQAQRLRPSPRFSLDKIRWHQVMDLSIENIAFELTRIDWVLYTSIRPRDLIRHVSLNTERKQRCKSLEFVNAMIDHFNHIAFWVSSMILIRDKPKHRALMLEKFMAIAWRLRQLNNYNSLGAIIAGINGTAVHRLVQTRGLVPPEKVKQYWRLEILMAPAKSYSAYRLGWRNTSSPRIPFVPLHRRDLVSAEAGNRTFIRTENGERINWKKFEIMGDVVIGIRESQGLPYPALCRNEEAQQLILNGKFSKDDDVREPHQPT